MTTYQLSRRGWISVEYAQWLWIPCPPIFPAGFDRDSWASLYARQWWWQSGREHGPPRLVSLGVWEATGDPAAQLRALVHADEPEAIEPPDVTEFATEGLGPG